MITERKETKLKTFFIEGIMETVAEYSMRGRRGLPRE